jgi:protein pelota
MRVLWKDMREGKVKVLVSTMDDLWYLSSIVEPGDEVSAVTYRRGETYTDAKREKRGEKKRMFLTLKVEKVEFHEFSDRLRIMGVITEGPQDHGQHHTFDLEPGDDVTIKKEEWCPHHWERIDEARRTSQMPILTFVSIDDETATLAVLRPQGLQVLATIHSDIQGKQYDHKAKGEKEGYFQEVLDTLGHHFGSRLAEEAKTKERSKGGDRGEDDGKDQRKGKEGEGASKEVIVLGPGFYKEDVVAYARNKGFDASFFIEPASQAGTGGIREVLRTGVTKVLENAKEAEDQRVMDRLLAEIGRDGKFTYGHDEVLRALELGAVEVVLVTDGFLRNPRMGDVGRLAFDTRALLRVLSTGYDAGKTLEGLGGLAAILRYKLED